MDSHPLQLSNRHTRLFQAWVLLWPVAWTYGAVAGWLSFFFAPRHPPAALPGLLLVNVGAGLFWLYYSRVFLPLRHVTLSGNALEVSGWRRSTVVPLDEIAEMQESWAHRPPYVILELRHPSVLGKRVRFLPAKTYRGDSRAAALLRERLGRRA